MRAPYADGFKTAAVELDAVRLPVEGSLPSWLRGVLLRNGPGCFERGGRPLVSWLDGLAMLSSFEFGDGPVLFRNRFLMTETFANAMAGRYRYAGFGTGPDRTVWEALEDARRLRVTDNANVNIAVLNGHYAALTETPRPILFEPATLNTLGAFPFDDSLRCMMSTPHPVYCPRERVQYNVAVEFGRTSRYHLYRMPVDSRRREVFATLSMRTPSYMHSLAVSPRFVILCNIPFMTSARRLLSFLLLNRPLAGLYDWHPGKGVCFFLMDKKNGVLAHIAETEAFFFFHIVNAFEENGDVVLDMTAYDTPAILDAFHLDRLQHAGNALPGGQLRRYRIPAREGRKHSGTITPETISGDAHEFPRIHTAHYGQSTCSYVYACGIQSPAADGFYNQLVKLDVRRGTAAYWREEGCYPGEPVFTAAPRARREDEGVILSLVLDTRSDASFLLVLDAAAFREVARVKTPLRIPFGFHGEYFPVR